MRLKYIDHYDSFSYNVVDWLQPPGNKVEIDHHQYDEPGLFSEIIDSGCAIVLSPGPKSPREVPQTLAIVERLIGHVPILGICLGHQILGTIAGFGLGRCLEPRHGTTEIISLVEGSWLYQMDVPQITAAVYNSLCLTDSAKANPGWQVTGRSVRGEIQIIENWENPLAPALGLQFHPESFLSEGSAKIRDSWYALLNQ